MTFEKCYNMNGKVGVILAISGFWSTGAESEREREFLAMDAFLVHLVMLMRESRSSSRVRLYESLIETHLRENDINTLKFHNWSNLYVKWIKSDTLIQMRQTEDGDGGEEIWDDSEWVPLHT